MCTSYYVLKYYDDKIIHFLDTEPRQRLILIEYDSLIARSVCLFLILYVRFDS